MFQDSSPEKKKKRMCGGDFTSDWDIAIFMELWM